MTTARLAIFLLGSVTLAAPAHADPASVAALAKDWQSISGQIDALTAARDHAAQELQSLAKDADESARGRADAEGRLKWTLDNWVPKVTTAPAEPSKP